MLGIHVWLEKLLTFSGIDEYVDYLGCIVSKHAEGSFRMSQEPYIEDTVALFGMGNFNSKPMSTGCPPPPVDSKEGILRADAHYGYSDIYQNDQSLPQAFVVLSV